MLSGLKEAKVGASDTVTEKIPLKNSPQAASRYMSKK